MVAENKCQGKASKEDTVGREHHGRMMGESNGPCVMTEMQARSQRSHNVAPAATHKTYKSNQIKKFQMPHDVWPGLASSKIIHGLGLINKDTSEIPSDIPLGLFLYQL